MQDNSRFLKKSKDCGVKINIEKHQEIDELIYESSANGRVGKARGRKAVLQALGSIYAERCVGIYRGDELADFNLYSND